MLIVVAMSVCKALPRYLPRDVPLGPLGVDPGESRRRKT